MDGDCFTYRELPAGVRSNRSDGPTADEVRALLRAQIFRLEIGAGFAFCTDEGMPWWAVMP